MARNMTGRFLWASAIIIAFAAQCSLGANAPSISQRSSAQESLIELRFPENLELPVLVDYVSRRLGINIVYDESISKKRVTISSPTKVSKDSLLGFLQSVLKMSGLILIDTEQPGWKKIVDDKDLLSHTTDLEADSATLDQSDATQAITQVFQLQHIQIATAEKTFRPFLSRPGGNILAFPAQVGAIRSPAATTKTKNYHDALILGPGDAIAIELDVGSSMLADVSILFHFEDFDA